MKFNTKLLDPEALVQYNLVSEGDADTGMTSAGTPEEVEEVVNGLAPLTGQGCCNSGSNCLPFAMSV